MRTVLTVAATLLLAAGSGLAAERHDTPEGWYQVEDGYGETPKSEYFIEVNAEETAAQIPPSAQGQRPAPHPQTATPSTTQPQQQRQQPDGAPSAAGAAQGAGQPPQAPTLREEIEEFQQVDCDEVRGRYLARVLEIHGVQPFWTDPRELAPLTYQRPPDGSGLLFPFGGALGDPALALLYGEPPVPPGALSFDFELQNLARDLLLCEAAYHSPQGAPPPAPPPARTPGAGPSEPPPGSR